MTLLKGSELQFILPGSRVYKLLGIAEFSGIDG